MTIFRGLDRRCHAASPSWWCLIYGALLPDASWECSQDVTFEFHSLFPKTGSVGCEHRFSGNLGPGSLLTLPPSVFLFLFRCLGVAFSLSFSASTVLEESSLTSQNVFILSHPLPQ